MEKKKVTLFIVSNEAGESRKLVLSLAWVKGLSFILVILFLVLLAGIIDYAGLLVQTVENKRLKIENDQLTKQFQAIEGKVSSLESSLERVKTFTSKLKLITNVESQERGLNLSMGVNNPSQKWVDEYDQPLDKRPPISELEPLDKPFSEKKPLDEIRGETAAENTKDYQILSVRIDKAIKESQLREQNVLDLWETLSERQSLLASTPSIRPARGWFTSRFGYRVSPFSGTVSLHTGLDIGGAPGSPIYAPADGVVTFVGYDEGYGKMIHIDHGYGVSTRYGHNSQVYVRVGQKVSRWDVIGAVGNTGRSTGAHLHYEVRVNDIPRNPLMYILDE